MSKVTPMPRLVMPSRAELMTMPLKEYAGWLEKARVAKLNYKALHADHAIAGDEDKLCDECARAAGLIE